MKISKKSLIEGLSYALDLAEGRYLSHSKHVAFTSLMIGKSLGLSVQELSDLYYTSLLHDIGAGNHYNIKEHALKGALIAGKLSLTEDMVLSIKYHHEYSNGSGEFGLVGKQVPLMSRIILLANLLDIHIQNNGLQTNSAISHSQLEDIKLYLTSLHQIVDNQILGVLLEIIERPYFILSYLDNNFDKVLQQHSVDVIDTLYNYDMVKVYAEIFSVIIDQRNSFTYNHSLGLAKLVKKVAKSLGYKKNIQEALQISSLLHDIGKLAIDNNIINKNGNLMDEERFEINKHTYYTKFVLDKIEGFELISRWASNHHETLDGQGYPFGFNASQLDSNDRLLAILDIYQALTEDRPYRTAFTQEKVWKILDENVSKGKLDGNLLSKIKRILY